MGWNDQFHSFSSTLNPVIRFIKKGVYDGSDHDLPGSKT